MTGRRSTDGSRPLRSWARSLLCLLAGAVIAVLTGVGFAVAGRVWRTRSAGALVTTS